MAEITINDTDLQGVKGKVVLMTGGSSGIGLATATLLLSLGAKVVNGDLNAPAEDNKSSSYTFVKTNVTSWSELTNLFKETLELHGQIDHVFANAGMRPTTSYLELEIDSNNEPIEPGFLTLDVNLRGVINTASLALHYMQKQKASSTPYSVVLTASSSSFHRFRCADYGISKHGVLGLLRGLTPVTYPDMPIRVNALCPSWTVTALTEESHYAGVDANLQPAEAVARAAVLLMSDEKRHGQMILSAANKYREIEEAVLLKAMSPEVRGQTLTEDEICAGVIANTMG
ncbi:NAD(P)-binding protein [Aureobasidium subglaciale]|nr:NAD(P)-binding protein [Aureobasidium subglaciale]